MNRVIKFRAWDASEKEMVCWPSLYNDPDDWFIYLLEGDEPDDVLMQFTGLTDKYGKEIYEGDIITGEIESQHGYLKMTGVVFYDHNGFRLRCIQDKCDAVRDGMVNYFDFIESNGDIFLQKEVIGNIYQNPELCP